MGVIISFSKIPPKYKKVGKTVDKSTSFRYNVVEEKQKTKGVLPMAMIPQISIFDNTEVYDNLGDLERVKLILDNIPDDKLLEAIRKDKDVKGRKGIALEALMNIYWSKKILQHRTMAQMLRELSRNSQLRKICGLQNDEIPSKYVMTRFMKKLKKHRNIIKEIFYAQRNELAKIKEDFGTNIGVDGKYIDSYAKKENKNKKADGRRDTEAKYGIKEKYYKDEKENEKIKKETHFGYRVHLMADVDYELPIDYEIETANEAEGKMFKKMLDKKENKEILKRTESATADKGYDDKKILEKLEGMDILPIIDKRKMNKEEKEIKRTVYYDDLGHVYCYSPWTAEKREMAYDGYDKKRDTHSYKCPVKAYGIECKGCEECPVKTKIRIKREENPKVFTEVARNTYKWKKMYNKRVALERINGRLDNGYEFENHTIRGKAKMEVEIHIAMSIMMTIALVNARLGKADKMRSLVKCA